MEDGLPSAHIAFAADGSCEFGTAGNSSLDAANPHVMLSVENCDYFEWWLPKEACKFGFVEDLALNSRSRLEAPTKPGLGCEIDWEWVRSNTVATLS